MKLSLIASALCFLLSSFANAQQVNIQLDFGQPQGLVLQADSMIVIFGQTELARPMVRMSNGTIGIGSRVITKTGYDVVVEGMSPGTDRIMVRYDRNGNSREQKALANLAVTNGCNGVFCVGERVVTSTGYDVLVVGLFGNGDVAVKYDNNGNSIETKSASNLAVQNACSSAFCTGDIVITSTGYRVKVMGLFNDGRVAVKYIDNGNSIEAKRGETLFLTEAVCANVYIQRVGTCF